MLLHGVCMHQSLQAAARIGAVQLGGKNLSPKSLLISEVHVRLYTTVSYAAMPFCLQYYLIFACTLLPCYLYANAKDLTCKLKILVATLQLINCQVVKYINILSCQITNIQFTGCKHTQLSYYKYLPDLNILSHQITKYSVAKVLNILSCQIIHVILSCRF